MKKPATLTLLIVIYIYIYIKNQQPWPCWLYYINLPRLLTFSNIYIYISLLRRRRSRAITLTICGLTRPQDGGRKQGKLTLTHACLCMSGSIPDIHTHTCTHTYRNINLQFHILCGLFSFMSNNMDVMQNYCLLTLTNYLIGWWRIRVHIACCENMTNCKMALALRCIVDNITASFSAWNSGFLQCINMFNGSARRHQSMSEIRHSHRVFPNYVASRIIPMSCKVAKKE